jgi:ABC-type molybdate transport system substrate-binding protein
MIRTKTFTSKLRIFHAMSELEALDRAVNEFVAANGIEKVVSVSDATTTGTQGETVGIIRVITYEEP